MISLSLFLLSTVQTSIGSVLLPVSTDLIGPEAVVI